MKDKFSFSNMLNNDKLMIICSIILGIIIWYSVVYGPSVTEEKSIRTHLGSAEHLGIGGR